MVPLEELGFNWPRQRRLVCRRLPRADVRSVIADACELEDLGITTTLRGDCTLTFSAPASISNALARSRGWRSAQPRRVICRMGRARGRGSEPLNRSGRLPDNTTLPTS